MLIVRPVTDDCLAGHDEFGQFVVRQANGAYTFATDVRGWTCKICNQKWQETGPSIRDQVYWNLIESMVHQTCLTRWLGLVERSEFRSMLGRTGLRYRRLEERENGYWSSDHDLSRPWYYTELVDYPIRLDLGWRKRVISLSLRSQGRTELGFYAEAERAFTAEQVTKSFSPNSIELHAWSKEKAQEYLITLADLILDDG